MACRWKLTTDQPHELKPAPVYLWEKLPELMSLPNHTTGDNDDDDNDDDDLNDQNNIVESEIIDDVYNSNEETNFQTSNLRWRGSTSNLTSTGKNTSLWILQNYDQIKLIVQREHAEKAKTEVKRLLSSYGIRAISNQDEQTCSWYFGLAFIRFELERMYKIDIAQMMAIPFSSFWLRFKNKTQQLQQQQQQQQLKRDRLKSERAKQFRFERSMPCLVSLRYGALTKLNEFSYSPQHSWSNKYNNTKLSISIENQRFGGSIQWWIKEPKQQFKKILLANNIDKTAIIHLFPSGFAIYICQKCNMNELIATEGSTAVIETNNRSVTKTLFPDNRSSQRLLFENTRLQRPSFENTRLQRPLFENTRLQRPSFENTRLQRPSFENTRPAQQTSFLGNQSLQIPLFSNNQAAQNPVFGTFKRIGIRNGTYYSTVRFEIRIDHDDLKKENVKTRVTETYNALTEFFTLHNIRMCYGTIDSREGTPIDLVSIQKSFTSTMKYSWQMLLNVGYCLQVRIDERFLQYILALSEEKINSDDLFYRVCVYLWRLFTLEPFVNLTEKLLDAIEELKRKQENSSFGLISSLKCTTNSESYVPSVTLTPTQVRLKPLKLCRTNRVLRAEKEFGKPLEHFVLVDIRDENGERLQSLHFRNLHDHFLYYLKNGFTLIDDNRHYQYLHHSQSQLRGSQFWFYHHEPGLNLSFDEAYRWMGTFDKEKNVAKYTSRIALCFSTTTPSINVDDKFVEYIPDIKTKDGKLTFTDGCGTISEALRDEISKKLGKKKSFSAIQFRYAGAKGVVSVNPQLGSNIHLCIRDSMNKFISKHRCFEVCKVSAPRSLYLNRQAILLLSNRNIPDSVFLTLQQRNHVTLIRSLIRNTDAQNLLSEKLPYWFLPERAVIDFVHEPFFRQLLITGCLSSVAELLRRTRIRIPANKARNMFGIIDEYNVLKPDEVFIQYTRLNDHEDDYEYDKQPKTQIIENSKVVITKNPCHHPGDVRTFTAVNHEALRHLKDVIVFSQQGDCPAPHQISGSDLDGDEYAVVWHEDLVPLQTPNATPYDYSSNKKPVDLDRPVTKDDIINVVLKIAESDFLGRLSNLHLAYADRYGVENKRRPNPDVLSTIELAGAISEEVDSGKTGEHPLSEAQINKQKQPLENTRPDFMENKNMKAYHSKHVLGKLYRSSRKTLPGWNQLLRKHRHLRHLEVRTPENDEEENAQQEANTEDNQSSTIILDTSLVDITPIELDKELSTFASHLLYVYRQEMLEILNLYGLSHENDLWCRQSRSSTKSELEDTAYTQLEQLVMRTRDAFFLQLVSYCPNDPSNCDRNTAFQSLCNTCQDLQHRTAVAIYKESYSSQNELERAPILSLPWLFTSALLQTRERQLPSTKGFLSLAMENRIKFLIENSLLKLDGLELSFHTSNHHQMQASVDYTVCAFVEMLHYCMKRKRSESWSIILSKFIRTTKSFEYHSSSLRPYHTTDNWYVMFNNGEQNDAYVGLLMSVVWDEEIEELMHSYFDQILNICFDLSQTITCDSNPYLDVSEAIILLLQKIAIGEI